MSIKVLRDVVVNQIAAGEVVERPASVVRELIDNALDAGAKDISVWIERGGRKLIRIIDDGSGMNRDDALLAFERHATSKIDELKDLDLIKTMGFRGEALSSIASVSKVTLKTQAADGIGTEVRVEGGVLKGVKPCSMKKGTEIIVENLFYNTPARRKFLRQPNTEERKIKHWISDIAIVNPSVSFSLNNENKELLRLPVRESLLDRAKELFRGTLVEIQNELGPIKVEGLIAHPSQAQARSSSLTCYVNRRLISDRMLVRAAKDGFDSTLKRQEYPLGFVSVELPQALVDINVHPQKSEVRFRDSQEIYKAVRSSILFGVQQFKDPMPGSSPMGEKSFTEAPSTSSSPFSSETATQEAIFATQSSSPEAKASEAADFKFSSLKYLGMIFDCYLLCQDSEKFVVVDMHAAHERYNFNLIRNSLKGKKLASQELLVPVIVELSDDDLARAKEYDDLLAKCGFIIDEFGDNALAVRATPTIVRDTDVPDIIKDVCASGTELEAGAKFDEVIDHLAARIACHASIRSGDKINETEVYALFNSLDSTEFSAACPHGRPVVVNFSKFDVERWFGRDR